MLNGPRDGEPRSNLWIHTRSTHDTSSQSTQHSPTVRMEFQHELVMFEINPSADRAYGPVISSQISANITARDAASVEIEPSSDVTSKPSLNPSSSLESCSHIPPTDEKSKVANGHMEDREETPGPGGVFEFVVEDPTIPTSRIDRRPRSKEQLESQKEESRLLRKFGGACLWCYRSKKKCGPTSPCQPCLSNRRKCIRSPDQLHLIGPTVITVGHDPSLFITGPLAPSELGRLCRLGHQPFQKVTRFHAVINFRPHGKVSQDNELPPSTWTMEVIEDDAVLSRRTRSAVDQFTSKASKYVLDNELGKLTDSYSDHPLVRTALKMAALFINICSTLKAPIYVHPFDMESGRLTMFVILVVCSQDLAEMSDNLAMDLCDALRRKDKGILDRISGMRHRQRSSYPLDPVWVATALYHRVVCGLLDLHCTSPPIRTVWGPVEEQLSSLRNSLWCILKTTYSSKGIIKDTVDEQIPFLLSTTSFDLAFGLGPIDHNESPSTPGIERQPGDPFAEAWWDMELFLSDELMQNLLPYAPEAFVSNIEPIHTRNFVQVSTAPSTIPDTIENILDPLRPTRWELMASMDAVYTDSIGCNSSQEGI